LYWAVQWQFSDPLNEEGSSTAQLRNDGMKFKAYVPFLWSEYCKMKIINRY
jgi:hypothetical protein